MNKLRQLCQSSSIITTIVCLAIIGFASEKIGSKRSYVWIGPPEWQPYYMAQARKRAIDEFAASLSGLEDYEFSITDIDINPSYTSLTVAEFPEEWHTQSIEMKQQIAFELTQDWAAIAEEYHVSGYLPLTLRDSEGNMITARGWDCTTWDCVFVKPEITKTDGH